VFQAITPEEAITNWLTMQAISHEGNTVLDNPGSRFEIYRKPYAGRK